MKNTIIIILLVVAILVGGYFLFPNLFNNNSNTDTTDTTGQVKLIDKTTETEEKSTNGEITKSTNGGQTIIGKSTEGRDIPVYQYGNGDTEILLIGGIHGGYAWNTSLLGFEIINYLKETPTIIPDNVKITIIPVLNPDGLSKVSEISKLSQLSKNPPALADTIVGRFNSNNVDLNRNFDCNWEKVALWQNKEVSGGDEVFSETESQAIKNYIEREKPTAVIVYYSAAGGVFSSSCNNGILTETRTLTKTYATASGYPSYDEFTAYETTGDIVNWLAKKNIPAISVLLTDHNNTEWTKNKAGVESILNYYAK
jgi:hypothetical protein